MIRYVHGIRYEMGHTNLLLEQVLVVGLLIWLASLPTNEYAPDEDRSSKKEV